MSHFNPKTGHFACIRRSVECFLDANLHVCLGPADVLLLHGVYYYGIP